MHDLIVLGGGAAGLAAAREGVRTGRSTLLVSAGPIGGDCTFTGCVPSKTLLASVSQGLSFTDAMARVRSTVASVAATEDESVLMAEGIDVRRGRARFIDRRRVDVEGETFSARRFVVATGAEPLVPSIEGLTDVPLVTSDTIFDLHESPGSLAIIGGGAIACELAQAFARAGVRTSVIEVEDRILSSHEREASAVLSEVLASDGVRLLTSTKVVKAERAGACARLFIEPGDPVEVELVVVAAGRKPSIDGMGLAEAGIEVSHEGIVSTDTLATTSRTVWAAGDVTGRDQLTHAADEMGRLAVSNAFGRRKRALTSVIPSVVFTSPEVATVGITEAEAIHVRGARVARLPLTEVDRAVTDDRTQGYVSLISGPRKLLGSVGGGKLIGATVVAPRAGELISELTLALRTKMFVGRLAQTVHPYPTWSMAIRQAAAMFFSRGGTAKSPMEDE